MKQNEADLAVGMFQNTRLVRLGSGRLARGPSDRSGVAGPGGRELVGARCLIDDYITKHFRHVIMDVFLLFLFKLAHVPSGSIGFLWIFQACSFSIS